MRKKSTFSLLFLSLISGGVLLAQAPMVGLRAGVSIPNLTAEGSQVNPLNSGYSSRFGPDVALFGQFQVTKVFSIRPMIEFSAQGGKKEGLQAFPISPDLAQLFPPGATPQYLYANFKSEAKINYLMIPILAQLGWDLGTHNRFRFFVDAGPFVALLLSAKQVTSGSSMIYLDEKGQQPLSLAGTQSFNNTQDIKSELHKANVGISGNVGLGYRLGQNLLFVEAGGNYGFVNIQKVDGDGKNKTGAATFCIGYAVALKH